MPHHFAQGSEFPPLKPEQLRFYGMTFCPYSVRVKLVLDYHKFDYEYICINLTNKPDWFTSRFPTGKVPAIEQGGEKMVESEMICLFLDQMHPENSLFTASGQEAVDAAKTWWNKMMPAFHNVLFGKELCDEKKQTYLDCLKEFEGMTKDPFISGSKVGLADLLVLPLLDCLEANFRSLEMPVPADSDRPRLWAWLNAMRSLPSVAEHRIDPERYYKYAQSVKADARDYEL